MVLYKEGTFDRNKDNTDYTSKKFCRETPTKAQPVPQSQEPPTCHNIYKKLCKKMIQIIKHESC